MAGKFWTRGIMLVTGCTKVSEGCKHCWSEQQHVVRSGNPRMHATYRPDCLINGKFNGKVGFNLRLLEKAAKVRKPQVYAIWNDLYHEGVTDIQIKQAWAYMMAAKQHTFLIVTKRIERISNQCHEPNPMPFQSHIWHIVTCENQAMARRRIPHLLNIPGKRGIIIEPMLAAIDLSGWLNDCRCGRCDYCLDIADDPVKNCIHQVILGGETGHGARPMKADWARSVRDQCASAGVPFYFKAWGSHNDWCIPKGRLLDGNEHNELAWMRS
jgi:protein gp37